MGRQERSGGANRAELGLYLKGARERVFVDGRPMTRKFVVAHPSIRPFKISERTLSPFLVAAASGLFEEPLADESSQAGAG
ncbi:hypothetical protein ABZ663_32430, partial [Streptomyces albidoflavus]|uniref:hypothetical protein n=1 Tax=Streptomyces albidoflavus TaxID=1886 RepID=UPI0033D3434A